MAAERDAVGRSAIDAPPFQLAEPGVADAERAAMRDRMAHGRLLDVRSEDADCAEFARHFNQC